LKLQERLKLARIDVSIVGGGSINDAYRVGNGNSLYFCKVNSATKFPHLFRKEKAGLERIARTGVIRTPEVKDIFEEDGKQVLLMEWVEEGARTPRFWTRFGEELSRLHRVMRESCGLEEDNYMGSVPQVNREPKSWSRFFEEQRLRPLVAQCLERKLLELRHEEMFENVYKRLTSIFEEEEPSLLHGDLWSGNFMCDRESLPC
jgi:protein-ribulosamine 3-kinase